MIVIYRLPTAHHSPLYRGDISRLYHSPLYRGDISRLYHSPLATHHSPLVRLSLISCICDRLNVMKDNLSLIAAAAGGFMLSLAASSIINAAPVTSLKLPNVVQTTSLQQPINPKLWGKKPI